MELFLQWVSIVATLALLAITAAFVLFVLLSAVTVFGLMFGAFALPENKPA